MKSTGTPFCQVSLPPATKLGQGYIFTGVCDSVHRGGLPQCILGYHPPDQAPPWEQTPPGADPLGADTHPHPGADTPQEQTPQGADTPRADTPQEQTPPSPWSRHPPRHRACWEIWSTRGRYASYWNAILFYLTLHKLGRGVYPPHTHTHLRFATP